jgi:hypothetical protein
MNAQFVERGLAIWDALCIMLLMRTHRDIVKALGHDRIASELGKPVTTVRSWYQRNSIPANEFLTFVERGWATADELVAARGVQAG